MGLRLRFRWDESKEGMRGLRGGLKWELKGCRERAIGESAECKYWEFSGRKKIEFDVGLSQSRPGTPFLS